MAGEEELFGFLDDLEQQAAAAFDAERAPELADRTRAEYREVTLAARLMASVGRDVTLHLRGAERLAGRLDGVHEDWVELGSSHARRIVRLDAVSVVENASERAVPEVAWPATTRLGIGSPLRGLAESRTACVVHRLDGQRHDGVVARVGQDFLELAVGEAENLVLIAFAAISVVQHDA